ncbi:MAG: DNA repair protein RecO [Actinomycetota bacterium]|nr:DNA repair protein RecO [Actinomycetota bacterium]
MSLYKTQGIVLKSIKLGEADKIITIYTNSRGKISAVAKGIRRTTSKFGSRLEPFTHVDLLVYQGRNLDTVAQAEIISSFKDIRDDLEKVEYGLAMLDLVDKITPDGEKDSQLFEFLLTVLGTLAKIKANLRLLLITFDIQLMSISGFHPSLFNCVVCGRHLSASSSRAVPTGRQAKFSCELGGIICMRCNHTVPAGREADVNAIPISSQSIDMLNRLLFMDIEEISGIEIDQKVEEELFKLTQGYVNYHLQVRLKSRKYLSKAGKGIREKSKGMRK